MKLRKTELAGKIPVFGHDKGIQLAQGGFNLDLTDLTPGATVKAGTPLGYDESTRVAKVVKTAKVVEAAGAEAVDYKVAKGHHFKVGDFLSNGGAASAISAINTTNADYDTITVAATIAAAGEGDVLFGAAATTASNAAYAVEAKGLLYNDAYVPADDVAIVDVVIRHANVYGRRVAPVTDAIKAKMPNIIYSQTF